MEEIYSDIEKMLDSWDTISADPPADIKNFFAKVAFYFGVDKEFATKALLFAVDDLVKEEYAKIRRPVDSFALWRRIDTPPDNPLSVLVLKDAVVLLRPEEIALLRSLLIRYDPRATKKYDTTKERKKVTNSLRFQILARDNFTCRLCGAMPSPVDNKVSLSVDHILPVSRGGKTSLDNLQTLCQRCNSGKQSKVVDRLIENSWLYQPPGEEAYSPYYSSPVFVQIEKPLTKWQTLVKAIAHIIFGNKE